MSLAVWCAVLLLGGATSAPPPQSSLAASSLQLQSMEGQPPDEESLSYLMGAGGAGGAGGRYSQAAAEGAEGAAWRGVLDPSIFVLSDLPRFQSYDWQRQKRKMPSLSISNPMEVLRQRLVLEIARKQMREHAQRQAEENRLFLQNVGKRGAWGEGRPLSRDDD